VLDQFVGRQNMLQLLPGIRQSFPGPIVMLTSNVNQTDRIQALESGVDDFVLKPLGTRELVAHVRAVLRRGPLTPAEAPASQPKVTRKRPSDKTRAREGREKRNSSQPNVASESRLSAEMRQAAEYVRAILPPPLTVGPVRTDWNYVPSSELGGDAFGYQLVDATTMTGFLLDVCGHGLASCLHAVNVANVLRRRAMPGVDFRDPGQVAAGLNTMFPMEDHGSSRSGTLLTTSRAARCAFALRATIRLS
jgi:hypothetical protein